MRSLFFQQFVWLLVNYMKIAGSKICIGTKDSFVEIHSCSHLKSTFNFLFESILTSFFTRFRSLSVMNYNYSKHILTSSLFMLLTIETICIMVILMVNPHTKINF